jgi:hypothetical protein
MVHRPSHTGRRGTEAGITLERAIFRRMRPWSVELGRLRASTFVYAIGVHALRLTQKSFFSEPVRSDTLLDSCGAFLYHCGARRMGTPGPDDDHPLRGELPAAEYDAAVPRFGDEGGAPWLGVSGSFTCAKAFGDTYRAMPLTKLFEDRGVLSVGMTIENLALPAISRRQSTTRHVRSPSRCSTWSSHWSHLPPPLSGAGRRFLAYFPLNHPPARGDHASNPSSSSQSGTSSHSVSRTSRLYSA